MRTTLLICFLLVNVHSWAHSFGRFGYVTYPDVPGLAIDAIGIKAKHPAADRLSFPSKLKQVKATEVNAAASNYFVQGGAFCPDRIRANLLSTGLELHYATGFRFKVSSIQAPYLSWSEASVEPGIPTAASQWCLISFRDAQPPILLSFIGDTCPVRVVGRSGEWRIESASLFSGWVRVALPLGVVAQATSGVAALGAQIKSVKLNEKFWIQPAPKILSTLTEATNSKVQVVWKLDRADAVLPTMFALAKRAGSHLKILSNYRAIEAPTEEGPMFASTEAKIAIEIPSLRIPSGRALVIGSPADDRFAPPPESVLTLSLRNLIANAPLGVRAAITPTLLKFIGEVEHDVEPQTGQKLPYQVDGKQIDLVASYALLMQSEQVAGGSDAQPNSLLTSVQWRRDWLSGTLRGIDSVRARNASSAIAVACAMCPEPERRAEGALFETGLLAEQGLMQWKKLKGFSSTVVRLEEPLSSLRRFLYPSALTVPDAFGLSLLSEVRIIGDPRVEVVRDARGLVAQWVATAPGQLRISSAFSIQLRQLANLADLRTVDAFGTLIADFSPTAPGTCEALMVLPAWAPRLPDFAAPPDIKFAAY